MPVSLHSLCFQKASAPALVILHGLLGSSRNWTTIGRALQDRFDVHALDLRNHGQSPHQESMRWSELVADLEAYRQANDIERFVLMGHSLGGKIAMRYACDFPARVDKLIIADIAAKAYPPYHDTEFCAMKRIPVSELNSRKEAEDLLEPLIENWALRQFILTNLVRDTNGGFKWQIHLEALHASLPTIRLNSLKDGSTFTGPSLLISGEHSDFVTQCDCSNMRIWLPKLREVVLPGVGHNVHVEDRRGFLDVLSGFI